MIRDTAYKLLNGNIDEFSFELMSTQKEIKNMEHKFSPSTIVLLLILIILIVRESHIIWLELNLIKC